MSDLFRKKSMDKISSPEELNDYIRVTSPSVWMVLAGTVILLVGFLAWGVFGTVNVEKANGTVESVHPITFVIN